jgi:hypothetical protein
MSQLSSTRSVTTTAGYLNDSVTPAVGSDLQQAVERPASRPPLLRLVVLVPDADLSEGRLANKLWSMASPPGLDILLLGLVRNTFREACAQRRLAAIASIARDKRTRVETRVAIGAGWEPLIRSVWQTGDLLVCHTEQNKTVYGIGREPLAPALASRLKIPVYAVSGFCPHLPPDWPEWLSQVFAILPLIVLLAGFLVALVGIQRFTTGPAQPVLLCLAVVIEYVLIAAWETFVTHRSIN